jgi:hypothetical protein
MVEKREKKSPTALNEKERRALKPIKNKFKKTQETEKKPMVLISENTIAVLEKLLYPESQNGNSCREDSDQDTEDLDYERNTSYGNAYAMAENYFSKLSEDSDNTGTKSIVTQIGHWLNKTFLRVRDSENYGNLQDGAAIGTFLVMKAFDIEMGPSFVESLKKVDPKEIELATNDVGGRLKNNMSIIEKSLSNLKIPDEQIFLDEFICNFISGNYLSAMMTSQAQSGAIFAFNVLEKLWPKLQEKRSIIGSRI